MAKKKGFLDFGQISSIIEDISKKGAIIIEKDLKKKTFIDTGIHILNALLSRSILYGGISKNRITIFAGPTGVGKSYLMYGIARNAQRDGYNVIYIDTEFSIEKGDLSDFGVDVSPERFMLLRTNRVEDLKIALSKILAQLREQKMAGVEIAKTIIILDSIGQLASTKEVEDAIEGKNKADMSRAKGIKSLFRIINSDLGYLEIPLVATNHIYMCLTEENEVQRSDGSYVPIAEIRVGDILKTLAGDRPVSKVVEYDKCPVVRLTLENGDNIECTHEHRFLVKPEWTPNEGDDCWRAAADLRPDDVIYRITKKSETIEGIEGKTVSLTGICITKAQPLDERKKTYDVQVEGSHHYILKNGVVSHNSQDLFPHAIMSGGEGVNYAASTIVYLTIAKLKTGEEDDLDLGSSGVVVTAKARKNRQAKPKKIQFEIDHTRGSNRFTGLEWFCTPENFEKVGIAKVKKGADSDGVLTYTPGNAKWYVRHLDKYFFDKQLHRSNIFTPEVLSALEPIIHDYFSYSSFEEQQAIAEEVDTLHEEVVTKDASSDEFDPFN